MRKALITKEQEQEIRIFKNAGYTFEDAMQEPLFISPRNTLGALTSGELALALLNWYEVEPEHNFEVGDWVRCEEVRETFRVAEVLGDGSLKTDKPTEKGAIYNPYFCRPAKAVEIKRELDDRDINKKINSFFLGLSDREREMLQMKLSGGE